jgi:signal transduction histidine kinase
MVPIRLCTPSCLIKNRITIRRLEGEADSLISADVGRLVPESETAMFRIVQECLTNIHRHSGSPVAAVRVFPADNTVCVEVADQGKGIAAEKHREMVLMGNTGVGIRGMQERLRHLGGILEIHSNGIGTVVRARFPIHNLRTSPASSVSARQS